MASGQNVHFLGVGRTHDQALVASHSFNVTVNLDAVEEVLAQPSTANMEVKKLASFKSGSMGWWLLKDESQLIYILITQPNYPQSVAYACLDDTQSKFYPTHGGKASTCNARGLDRAAGKMLKQVCQKYDNLEEVDRLASVTRKVDSVKLIMQENVEIALQNCVRLENIELAAEELQAQAGQFSRGARDLRKKMWWKNLKMKLLLAAIITAILAVIIIAIVIWYCGGNDCK
uniref:V-SNARE coiled-coil homology domain-containing protein n=1 Tax=Fibrocapsa japonica TaxID=94617 RepID=A0A7S2V2S9_9STRA|mmetsp:Transcript_4575/g.6839  ORF Transcript_4575/g.6839 Transcript_4575/m.6839 type:complete len:231 (+) Transcript_4575:88-780(+)